jgi:hypothetical protein
VAKKNDRSKFTDNIRRLNALACSKYKRDDFDIDHAIEKSEYSLKALGAKGILQEMIAAQLLSTHRMQQLSTAMANESEHMDNKQYYTNAAIKLANCFIQQASLLARLQGYGGQKIIVERIDVHQGAQAVVGIINGEIPSNGVKK